MSLWSRIRRTWRGDRHAAEIREELQFHLDMEAAEGLTQREARVRFGNVRRIEEDTRAVSIVQWLESCGQDVRYAIRGFRKAPGFTTAVVLTLMLGIGGNTAIFSVVDQLLLRPLPYPHGDQLLTIRESAATVGRMSVSPANWLDWQRQSRTLETVAAWNTQVLTLTGIDDPTRLNVQLVSSEFFPLLGVAPLLGRTVSEADDRPDAGRVVVLSHEFWQRRFGGATSVIGRTIQLNDRPAEIIGVMPGDFHFLYTDNDVWMAYRLDRNQAWRNVAGRFIQTVARLKPGTSLAGARAEMDGIARQLATTYTFNKGTGVTLVPLREELTGQVHTSLLVLYGAVGVLLAIACFNVANLFLARNASRRGEIAIRTALGASGWTIVRQLLVESLLLAGAGGALGIGLARWSLSALMRFAPADLLRVPELLVDRRVLLYALSLSMVTGLIVALVPAVLVARRSMVAPIQASGLRVTHSPRIRQLLVVCQVAMTVVLLCGAGLLVRTLVALDRAHNGFDKHDVLTMEVALPAGRYVPERATAFYREAVAALRTLPGVESVAAANSLAVIGTPRGGSAFHRLGAPGVWTTTGRPADLSASSPTLIRVVTPGYFQTLRIPIVHGREFTEADDANPRPGFIVNEAFAKAFLSDIDPLTASISVWMQPENPYLPVIGVVGNVSEGSVRDEAQPTVFYSHRQMAETGMTLFARTIRPEALAKPAVAALQAIDPTLAVTKIRTLEDALGESVARERLDALVSAAFALSGLLLASLGLYGLLAFLVTERTKEIGIRIALGEQLGHLTRSVVGGGLQLVVVGAALGLAGSVLALRWLAGLLYGVTPYDVTTYASVVALLSAIAALASYVPARRATKVDPLVALRCE